MKKERLILAIESSCDETAAALVVDGRKIVSNVIASQADFHKQFGGVVPEIASRMHVEAILPVIDQALTEGQVGLADLDAIAVTNGPGLLGALLVGLSAAKGLAMASGKPLIAVHHIAGHIAANYLAHADLEPPFLCLVVSGGHSHLIMVEGYDNFKILGRTRDDAAGEAFDKIARALDLGYPGGPLLDRAAAGGAIDAFDLPRSHFKDSYDFSFSGLKTAALNKLNSLKQEASHKDCQWQDLLALKDFAASYQHAIVEVLVDHTIQAAQDLGVDKVAMAGGVSANSALRTLMQKETRAQGFKLYYPPPILCTDNAAMIAAAAFYRWQSRGESPMSTNAYANMEL